MNVTRYFHHVYFDITNCYTHTTYMIKKTTTWRQRKLYAATAINIQYSIEPAIRNEELAI